MDPFQDPDHRQDDDEKWRPLRILVAIFIGLMLVVGSTDVTMRYLFDSPLSWGLPVVGILLGLTIFSGLIIVTGEDDHISVGLLDKWIVGRRKFVQTIAVYIVSLGALAFIAERMFALSVRQYENENLHMMIDLPLWPFSATFAVLSAFAGLFVVRNLVRRLRRRDSDD